LSGDQRRRSWLPPLVVFGIVLAVRSAVWVALESTVLADWHLWKQTDEHAFLEWSARLAAGNWLDIPPYRAYPGFQVVYGGPEFWERFFAKGAYYSGPLYAYALAALRRLFGEVVAPARAAQLLLACAASAALAAAVARIVRRRVAPAAAPCGVLAGCAYGLYGPLVFHDGLLLRDGPFTHVTTLLLALPLLGAWPPVIGVLASAALLTKQTAAPIALTALWAAIRGAPATRRRATLAATVLAFILPLALFAVRNVVAGAGPLTFDARQAYNLAWGNAHGADGTLTFPGEAVAVLEGAHGSTAKAALLVLRGYRGRWGELCSLSAKKLALFFNAYEASDNASLPFFTERLGILGLLPGFPLLLGSGLAGLVLALRTRLLEKADAIVCVAAFATPLLSCLLVPPNSRYRVGVAGPLAFGAGLFAALVWERRAMPVRALALAAGAAAISCASLLPPPIPAPRHRSADALVYATLLERNGRPREGAEEIRRYVLEGLDDTERAAGLEAARFWWVGGRAPAILDPSELAPPEKRFRAPLSTFPQPPDEPKR
jgi:hypothetical protein